jgi:hypothetical protein
MARTQTNIFLAHERLDVINPLNEYCGMDSYSKTDEGLGDVIAVRRENNRY